MLCEKRLFDCWFGVCIYSCPPTRRVQVSLYLRVPHQVSLYLCVPHQVSLYLCVPPQVRTGVPPPS